MAEKAGLPFSLNNNTKDESSVLYNIMEEATKFFELNLSKNKEAFDYLTNRGLKKNTITSFRIGYAKEEWSSLYDHLVKKGFRLNDIEKVGLIKNSQSGNHYYDRFRGREIGRASCRERV